MDKIRIFVADEDSGWINKLCDHLKSKPNFEIIGTADSGKDICTALPALEPDLLIMDIGITSPNGTDVLRALDKIKFRKRPAIIVTSHKGQCIMTRTAVKLGAVYCMVKPIDFSVLTERIIQFASIAPQYTEEKTKKPEEPGNNIKCEITDMMREIGLPAHIKGYWYIRSAVLMVIDDSELLGAITKQLYPKIAKNYSTTNSRVERAIRHGIEIAFERGDPKILSTYFGTSYQKGGRKPTNSEFIAMLSDRIRLKTKSLINYTEAQ